MNDSRWGHGVLATLPFNRRCADDPQVEVHGGWDAITLLNLFVVGDTDLRRALRGETMKEQEKESPVGGGWRHPIPLARSQDRAEVRPRSVECRGTRSSGLLTHSRRRRRVCRQQERAVGSRHFPAEKTSCRRAPLHCRYLGAYQLPPPHSSVLPTQPHRHLSIQLWPLEVWLKSQPVAIQGTDTNTTYLAEEDHGLMAGKVDTAQIW
ncbi:hypothetical protein AAG570_000152 [Ranatra chinensis]|uniref:Uncharacterized protein n=1 Tax=Ranatra chinensis TaxID=642074 RepID=A0ABD0YW94_9HEMI